MAVEPPLDAKDFSRYPELIPTYIARLKRAQEVSKTYLRLSPLINYGLVKFHNFLDESQTAAISSEISCLGIGDAKRQDNLVTSQPVRSASRGCAQKMLTIIKGFYSDRFEEVQTKFFRNTYLQHLLNSPDDNDIQKVFHSDTFFPCLKFWYFPNAVRECDGPLMYVPFSVVLTERFLQWHERQIISIRDDCVEGWRGRGHKEGSLRISITELQTLGLEPVSVSVPSNTLVVANVFGFHRRGDTTRPTHRYSIHGSIRMDKPI